MTESAALPVLASTELDYQLRKDATRKRIKSGCSAIDNVLKGGLDSGRIACISGDKALGKTTVCPMMHESACNGTGLILSDCAAISCNAHSKFKYRRSRYNRH